MEIRNGIIKSARLGIDGMAGLITFKLKIDLGGGHEPTFGRFQISQCRCEIFTALIHVVGVEWWDELEGTAVRVKIGDNPDRDGLVAIGNIIADEWFDMEAEGKRYAEPESANDERREQ